ncbi:hypothetical protein [Thalassotalea agarivorans]|uniref:DUF4926 domain-containing protein n=1 Tax=Thalassotalea agarivorans TaxID=349064 RepID=A0A1I0EWM7_THASX|nr:hypothetical protein [Thalassotalea agarivorans]SET49900.1 hypothetical protein SAMN05660429_01970 [Thalassotalea agarivorans]
MKQFSVVKIIELNKEFTLSESDLGTRAPLVGDVGTIVDVYGSDFYIE